MLTWRSDWAGSALCHGCQDEELGAQGRNRRVDHRVTQKPALGFEGGDAGD